MELDQEDKDQEPVEALSTDRLDRVLVPVRNVVTLNLIKEEFLVRRITVLNATLP